MRSAWPEVYDQSADDFNRRLGALVPLKQTSKHLLLIFLILASFNSCQFSQKYCLSVLLRTLSIFMHYSIRKSIYLIPWNNLSRYSRITRLSCLPFLKKGLLRRLRRDQKWQKSSRGRVSSLRGWSPMMFLVKNTRISLLNCKKLVYRVISFDPYLLVQLLEIMESWIMCWTRASQY